MKTQLHINLHRQKAGLPNIVSITQSGKVVGYCSSATLLDVTVWQDDKKAAFSRTPGNKRTVHIAVKGTLIDVVGFESFKGRKVYISPEDDVWNGGVDVPTNRRSHYSPLRQEAGFMVDGQVWNGGKACTVTDNGMYVS
jgi:hypothetical protein